MMAGEVCIKAKEKEDYSVKILKEYEDKWRAMIGKEPMTKSFRVKNLLIKLTDEQLNELARSLEGMDTNKMELSSLLLALFKKNPKLLWELRTLFK